MAPSHPHPSGATATGAQLFYTFGIARFKVSRRPIRTRAPKASHTLTSHHS